MNALPSLAAVLDQHSERGEGCCYHCCDDEVCGVGALSIAEHQARKWREACTVRTAEQLDALPIGSVIRTDEGRVAVKTGERWGNQSGHGSWWSVADEDEFDVSSDELDDLPALLVWHPDWSDCDEQSVG